MVVSINITETAIEINGKAVALPCHVDDLLAILGEARRTTFGKIESNLFDENELEYLNAQAPDRANYTWDDLGVLCYTDEGFTVNTVSVHLRDSTLVNSPQYYPQSKFSGVLTINGRPWVKQLNDGDKDSTSIDMTVGIYSVYASFADLKSHLFNREAKFSTVEISLEENDYDDDDFDDLFTK